MQLDADEDGEPFFRPPAISAAPAKPRDDPTLESSEESAQAAAATMTAEQED